MATTTVSKQDKKLSRKLPTDYPNEVVEEQTKKIPNLVFMGFAGAALLLSAGLTVSRRVTLGNFVGLWVPSILMLGLYNKMVKVEDEVLEHASTIH